MNPIGSHHKIVLAARAVVEDDRDPFVMLAEGSDPSTEAARSGGGLECFVQPSCAVPECRGISHADATFREALWDRFFTAAPRPRTPSELLYSDRRLRSKSSLAATILIRKR